MKIAGSDIWLGCVRSKKWHFSVIFAHKLFRGGGSRRMRRTWGAPAECAERGGLPQNARKARGAPTECAECGGLPQNARKAPSGVKNGASGISVSCLGATASYAGSANRKQPTIPASERPNLCRGPTFVGHNIGCASSHTAFLQIKN